MARAGGGGLGRGLVTIAALAIATAGCAAAPARPTRGEVLQQILPATVQVVLEESGRRFRSGSGVVVGSRPAGGGADCFVLTSAHTLAGLAASQEVHVLLGRHKGPGTKARARVLARGESDDLDLALLEVRARHCVAAQLGALPALGDTIWVVAFPWGRSMTLAGGVVSQLNAETAEEREAGARLMVDASVSYGASGGGVFDAETGRLVGLVEGYRTARVAFKNDSLARYIEVPVPGETYVTPLADVRRFLRDSGYARLLGEVPALAGPPGPAAGAREARP